jgi:hypothetical protein
MQRQRKKEASFSALHFFQNSSEYALKLFSLVWVVVVRP